MAVENNDTQAPKSNVMRGTYRELSEDEKQQMRHIKEAGEEFLKLLGRISATSGHGRELALARTKMEEAVMWAVKHVTS